MPKRSPAPAAAPAAWFVYMLECAGGRIYTGVTPDLAARFAKHCAGRGAAYTRMNKPVRMLAARACGDRGAALREEAGLKKLPRPQKLEWAKRFAVAEAPTRTSAAAPD